MPQALSKPPEYKVINLLQDSTNWNANNTAGYDPTLNRTDPDFLIISDQWNAGDQYPSVSITNANADVVNGGSMNVTSKGPNNENNQHRIVNMLCTVHASGDTSYNNGNNNREIAKLIYDEIFRIIWNNQHATNDSEVWAYSMSSPETTNEVNDSTGFIQMQGQIQLEWQRTES